jgi:hypothetical protein
LLFFHSFYWEFVGKIHFENPAFRDSQCLAPTRWLIHEIENPVFDQIPADLADEQKDKALQLEAWQIFANLIPAKDRQMVTQYNIFTDGTENTLAAVDQIAADPSSSVIEVDIADLGNKDALLFTLIHEYAHLLTSTLHK